MSQGMQRQMHVNGEVYKRGGKSVHKGGEELKRKEGKKKKGRGKEKEKEIGIPMV